MVDLRGQSFVRFLLELELKAKLKDEECILAVEYCLAQKTRENS